MHVSRLAYIVMGTDSIEHHPWVDIAPVLWAHRPDSNEIRLADCGHGGTAGQVHEASAVKQSADQRRGRA